MSNLTNNDVENTYLTLSMNERLSLNPNRLIAKNTLNILKPIPIRVQPFNCNSNVDLHQQYQPQKSSNFFSADLFKNQVKTTINNNYDHYLSNYSENVDSQTSSDKYQPKTQ